MNDIWSAGRWMDLGDADVARDVTRALNDHQGYCHDAGYPCDHPEEVAQIFANAYRRVTGLRLSEPPSE